MTRNPERTSPSGLWVRAKHGLLAVIHAPADRLGPALLVGLSVSVVGGVVVAVVAGSGDDRGGIDRPTTMSQPAAGRVSCEPAMHFKGFNDDLPPGSITPGPPPPGSYNGQIAGGDFLRVSSRTRPHFSDSVTVRPGDVVAIGLRLDNPGGTVADVLAHVVLPRFASNALELRARVRFQGVTGLGVVTDTAAILVGPSMARACARYILGSSTVKVGDGIPRPTLDWITSKGGAYFGSIGDRLEDIQIFYFKVVVV